MTDDDDSDTYIDENGDVRVRRNIKAGETFYLPADHLAVIQTQARMSVFALVSAGLVSAGHAPVCAMNTVYNGSDCTCHLGGEVGMFCSVCFAPADAIRVTGFRGGEAVAVVLPSPRHPDCPGNFRETVNHRPWAYRLKRVLERLDVAHEYTGEGEG